MSRRLGSRPARSKPGSAAAWTESGCSHERPVVQRYRPTTAGTSACGCPGCRPSWRRSLPLLAVAFWVFQVAQHQKFDEMAENNHRRRLPLPAPRGVLFDRHGKVLVENQNTFNIALVPRAVRQHRRHAAPACRGHRRRRSDDARDGQPPASRAELPADRPDRERDHARRSSAFKARRLELPGHHRAGSAGAPVPARARWRRICSATSARPARPI